MKKYILKNNKLYDANNNNLIAYKKNNKIYHKKGFSFNKLKSIFNFIDEQKIKEDIKELEIKIEDSKKIIDNYIEQFKKIKKI